MLISSFLLRLKREFAVELSAVSTSNSLGIGTGLHHPFQQEPIDLGSSTEGVHGCVIEADATEVGIANVVGKRHLADSHGIVARFDAIHAILRVFGLGGNSRIGGVKGGDTVGERGGGVHVLNNDDYL